MSNYFALQILVMKEIITHTVIIKSSVEQLLIRLMNILLWFPCFIRLVLREIVKQAFCLMSSNSYYSVLLSHPNIYSHTHFHILASSRLSELFPALFYLFQNLNSLVISSQLKHSKKIISNIWLKTDMLSLPVLMFEKDA